MNKMSRISLLLKLNKTSKFLRSCRYYSNNITTERVIFDLQDLIERRSFLKTEEIKVMLEKIIIDNNDIKLPISYFHNSIDVCASRGDIHSALYILELAGL